MPGMVLQEADAGAVRASPISAHHCKYSLTSFSGNGPLPGKSFRNSSKYALTETTSMVYYGSEAQNSIHQKWYSLIANPFKEVRLYLVVIKGCGVL